ncbi:MAG: hypothetical protein A2Y14_02875 [Verrucomicrobia bacterium GWF2_51_19]|nr:MAG: hypothetical protein A2Y14_02875 [Verrucomicrobia bacterium GWF2_51_19]HCJ11827.1 hypothetical protein [Opitutae bacterium]
MFISKRIQLLILLGVGVLLLVPTLLFHVSIELPTTKPATPTYLAYADAANASALLDQMLFFDTKPIYLTTPYNTVTAIPPKSTPAQEDPFLSKFGPSLLLKETLLFPKPEFEEPSLAQIVCTLGESYWTFLKYFGQAPVAIVPLLTRSACITLKNAETAEVTTYSLPPQIDASPWSQPLEGIIQVDAMGIVGKPILLNSSGNKKRDQVLVSILAAPPFSRQQGTFLFTIGP